jgi:molecular chaperone DnaJ
LSVPASRHGDIEISLELEVEIEPHPIFALGSDGLLRCEMPVNGYAWMANRWVEIPTPNGLQQMRLNRDALSYRMSGQGFPTMLRGPRGDYIVKVVPVFPAQDDPGQEALLDRLIERSTKAIQADPSRPLAQWQRKLKRWDAKPKESGHGD